jgi:hypothetical protein
MSGHNLYFSFVFTDKLQRYFSFWKQTRDDSLLSRLKREQASQHYNRVVLQHLMIQWKQFVQVGRRGCDRVVVGFTTTYEISAYHY